ncbi:MULTISPECIES: ATP-binding protein [unclassified Streptomyces]|uniref:ATP-binding protein n=1 Tax=unclassified Streptomyces TaxID=2593676 RepID=UPI000DAF155D|nr:MULTISPECIES: ATP-binding protein [unclassified Streptomyces]PZT77206.1 ATP-binding protein [Streptomyces sp. AC1-42W]PZT78842.1 ATP-binding protein [Streptomyces sp. AC1-42T]
MAWIVTVIAFVVAGVAYSRAYRAGLAEQQAVTRAELADRQAKAAEARTAALLDEIRQLARKRIPAAALALSHPSATVPGLREAAEVDGGAALLLTEAVQAARTAVLEERGRVDAAARAAMRGTSAKIQSLLNQSQQLLHELQHEYDDPRILQLDFRNELALRRTQSTAVLCDAWPGLARQNSPLVEIVLGAQSRVAGYERIKVSNHLRDERLALAARAAEPLAIALAELLANATAYSHPDTDVQVTIQQSGGRGAFLVVDDAGIGMDEDALERARALLAGPAEVLLTELGDPPQTGFAVVGRLVVQYGFDCHIEASPFGGMRTMLRVPAHLLTVLDEDRDLSALAPAPVSAAADRPAPAAAPGTESGSDGAEDPTGLPSRRRRAPRRTPAAPAGGRAAEPATGQMPRTPEAAGASWAALQQGTLNGRSVTGRPAAPDTGARDHQDDQGDDEK